MPGQTTTLKLRVRDIPGVLVRIAHIFARRGINVRSLNVQPEADNTWSVMTIVIETTPRAQELIHQLEKLVDVDKVYY